MSAYKRVARIGGVVLFVHGLASGPALGQDTRSESSEGWLWAFAPGVGYTSDLDWTVSAGLFVGPIVGRPDEGYSVAVGGLLQLERSSRGRRFAAGPHLVVSHDGIPIVGTLGGGVNLAYVELNDALSSEVDPIKLLGPEISLAFVGRIRIGYLWQTSPDTSGAGTRSGFTWSVGVGF